jgi:hypothetical protein
MVIGIYLVNDLFAFLGSAYAAHGANVSAITAIGAFRRVNSVFIVILTYRF